MYQDSRRKRKSASKKRVASPYILSEPLSLFIGIQLQWLESMGHFAPSDEAKSASLSGAPMSKDSERATFAFCLHLLQW